jgi:quercetin dioxygenase-like cupin family protein
MSIRALACTSLLVAAAAGAGDASGQQPRAAAPPSGFNVKVLASIDLGPEIEGMQGRVLRMSHVTVAPGSTMAAHPHKDRPEIIYVLEGTLSEARNGGAFIDHPAGSVLVMTGTVTHALANRTAAPVVYVATPIAR